jgi:hypothetical protein
MRKGTRVALAAALVALLAPAGARAQDPQPSKRCDFIDPAVCLYPWPNDLFTKKSRFTATGRRLHLRRASMPQNKEGVPIDPRDQNRADGFSPGSMLITKVPGLETLEAAESSKLPPIGDLSQSLARRSPVVVINARTGVRHPVWAEIDFNPPRLDDRVLIIRPGRNFDEGERYIVALRNLRNAAGARLHANLNFRLYRDRIRTHSRLVERRRGHFEDIFRALKRAGVKRRGLYLAWDFTVASRRSLSARMLSIRDQAFDALGDANLGDLRVQGRPPAFTVDVVQDRPPGEDDRIARRVEGTITAPCFLTDACAPGGRFVLNRRGLPVQQGSTTYRWYCNIPRSALDAASAPPARPALYGHGLLGRPTEIDASNVKSMAHEHNFVFCATAWAGFASEDVGHIVGSVIPDLSRFDTAADRMQQGFLQQLLLGRALIHPQGFASHPAFQRDGRSVIDGRRLFFDSNSQGAIMGGALTALAPDFERAVLGVPGMNYSTLLQRSVDYDTYRALIDPSYPREIERQLMFSVMQLLWDRGEADGYAHHMTTRPLPDTPTHAVLLHVAFGDHQVADITSSVEARTIGARIHQPALAPGRSPLADPWWGIPPIVTPYSGSAVVWWDDGTPASPLTNTPNRAGDDPHEVPRAQVAARAQKSAFLSVGGTFVDVCGGGPCFAGGYTGP